MARKPTRPNHPRAASTETPVAAEPALTPESWVSRLVDAVEHGGIAPVATVSDERVAQVARCFALDELEREVLAIAVAAERSFALAKRLGQLSGSGQLTVGLVAELLRLTGRVGLHERLGPCAPLRQRALIHVAGADRRHVSASDPVRLEVGLEPSLPLGSESSDYRVISPDPERAHAPRPAFAQRAQLKAPQVLWLEGGAPFGPLPIAEALADQLTRRVVCVMLGSELDVDRASRLRRDADLAGAILLVRAPTPRALEALLVPPPVFTADAPALVALLDCPVDEQAVKSPWLLRRDRPGLEPPRTATATAPLDYIRELAQRDADRALGIVRPAPRPRPVVPGHIVDSTPKVALETAPEAVVEKAPEPVATQAPQPVVDEAPEPVVEKAPEPVAAATSAPEPVAEQRPLVPPAPPMADDSPRLEVPANAPPEVVARAALQSQSAAQRVELMRSLAGIKSPAVVAALRHNAKSENAQVREVAEVLMAQMFGPSWNKTRAITPPIQPPPSEE